MAIIENLSLSNKDDIIIISNETDEVKTDHEKDSSDLMGLRKQKTRIYYNAHYLISIMPIEWQRKHLESKSRTIVLDFTRYIKDNVTANAVLKSTGFFH